MELYHATGKTKYREQAERWAEKHAWREGTEGSGMNKLFCVMTRGGTVPMAANRFSSSLREMGTRAMPCTVPS